MLNGASVQKRKRKEDTQIKASNSDHVAELGPVQNGYICRYKCFLNLRCGATCSYIIDASIWTLAFFKGIKLLDLST